MTLSRAREIVKHLGRRTFVGTGTAIVLAMLLLSPSAASAHTDFASSTPADGSVLNSPVDEIIVTFTAPAELAGDGFALLSPNGEILQPPVERSEDGRTFTMAFEPPLTDGEYAVRWSVRAGDAHPIEGVFTFETTAPAPEPEPEATTTTTQPPTTTTPESSVLPETSVAVTPAETPTTPTTQSVASAEDPTEAANDGISLEEFVEAQGDGVDGQATARVGRIVAIPSALILIGAVAFASLVGRGRPSRWMTPLIYTMSGMLLLGSGLELFGLAHSFDSVTDAASSSTGGAILLRAAAAVLAVLGAATRTRPVTIGAALAALISFQFDGHTVSEGQRWLMVVADAAHVAAGSVWFGGIVCLFLAHRSGDESSFAPLAVRFSVVAAGAVAVAGIAGIALTLNIIDSLSDLWRTSWGQLLIAKTLLVAIAVSIGVFNHFGLVPQIDRVDNAPIAIRNLGRTIRVEAVLLLATGFLTALLVAASTAQ